MKVKRTKTYHLRNGIKELSSVSYLTTSGNKTFTAYYSMRNGKLSKTSEERKIGDRYTQTIRYSKDSISKTNYYYHSNGKLKRWETIAFGGVQQYWDNKIDQNGNIISTETEDSLIYYEKIISNKTNRRYVIEYTYDKYTEPVGAPIVEGIEVKVFKDALLTHLIEYGDGLKTYSDLEEIRNHYKDYKHLRIGKIGYTDFSGLLQDIPVPNNHHETHYSYHDNGNLKKEIKYFCSNNRNEEGGNQNKVISEIHYNENGAMVSRIFENKETTRQEYKFDKEGNWVEVKVFRNDTLISTFMREEEIIDNIDP